MNIFAINVLNFYKQLKMKNLRINNERVKKRVITKVLKLDENNQFGNGITKSLPTGCIKDNKHISWETFNFLVETVSVDDKIGHLYIVDTEFDVKDATKNNLRIMQFICQLLKNKKQLIPVKGLFFNFWNNLWLKKAQEVIERALKLTQIFLRNVFYQCI